MRTYENRTLESASSRSHPWTTSTDNPQHRYYDLRARPDLIASVLEDFRPWDAYSAVRSFYDLIAWINGPASPFVSNDCAFNGPGDNTEKSVAKRLECSGRLGLLFRDLRVNTSAPAVTRLIERIHAALTPIDPGFAFGAVGTTRLTVDYLELPEGAVRGAQVLLSFWAWGDDEPEVFAHLARVIAALREALESITG